MAPRGYSLGLDRRLEPMLAGYFQDMGLVLEALRKHLEPGGLVALVVGNVRHGGVMVSVDQILVGMGEGAGYAFVGPGWCASRENSAQQMGRFGREPARESVVFLRAR